MVDFNNEATIGTAAVDVERISILQRRYDLIEALEDYRKKRIAGAGVGLNIVRARLFSLFLEIQAYLKRKLTKENRLKEYETLRDSCLTETKEEEILRLIYRINEELDVLRLTRIDTRQVYDETDTEAENEIKGF